MQKERAPCHSSASCSGMIPNFHIFTSQGAASSFSSCSAAPANFYLLLRRQHIENLIALHTLVPLKHRFCLPNSYAARVTVRGEFAIKMSYCIARFFCNTLFGWLHVRSPERFTALPNLLSRDNC